MIRITEGRVVSDLAASPRASRAAYAGRDTAAVFRRGKPRRPREFDTRDRGDPVNPTWKAEETP
ncbi:hypothetical protein ACFQX6_01470 [Streptosporangium lutulentum]